MRRTKEQKALDEELIRECQGYRTRDNKPDGAYIEKYGRFFNINKIKHLIEKGADVNAKNKWDNTPLHLAAWGDNMELGKLLIEMGADVNAKGYLDKTPLQYAQSEEMKALLREHGATE